MRTRAILPLVMLRSRLSWTRTSLFLRAISSTLMTTQQSNPPCAYLARRHRLLRNWPLTTSLICLTDPGVPTALRHAGRTPSIGHPRPNQNAQHLCLLQIIALCEIQRTVNVSPSSSHASTPLGPCSAQSWMQRARSQRLLPDLPGSSASPATQRSSTAATKKVPFVPSSRKLSRPLAAKASANALTLSRWCPKLQLWGNLNPMAVRKMPCRNSKICFDVTNRHWKPTWILKSLSPSQS